MRNLINPEIKKSSGLVAFIFLTLIIVINIVITINFNSIKNGYIDSRAAVIGELTRKYPELEQEIVKVSFQDIDKVMISRGNEVVERYGYNKNISVRFIPLIYDAFKDSRLMLTMIIIGFCIVIIGLNFWQYEIIYSRVRILAKASKEILEGNYDMNIYEEEEGDFAKLSFGFKNMRSIIRSQMMDLKKEKTFLVNLLSDISHQLKTPLAALVVYNDILSKPGITEENKIKFLISSKNQLSRMEWLIKSMLKLAKVDARAIDFKIKKNNLNETIESVVETLDIMAQENNVQLCIDEDLIEEQTWSEYDEQWFSEALINIIKNSIEHSKGGKVVITLEETLINTKIIIKDNGEGIEEDALPNIFKRFYKGGKSDSVGIGLSLSKAIIEAQNGYIEVKSKVDEGTEFKVVLLKK